MAGQAAQINQATVLLRCEELQDHLNITKETLNQSAAQLKELTQILLSHKSPSHSFLSRPWLEELAFSQLIADVFETEQKLAEVRAAAAELGIALPT